jgi:hypothetical protein
MSVVIIMKKILVFNLVTIWGFNFEMIFFGFLSIGFGDLLHTKFGGFFLMDLVTITHHLGVLLR